jgi:hypothetical protein
MKALDERRKSGRKTIFLIKKSSKKKEEQTTKHSIPSLAGVVSVREWPESN